VIREPHRDELLAYLHPDDVLAASRLALVEVPRAVALASPAEAVEEADRMLASCLLVDVSDRLLRDARALASRQIRTLDAIHLATALYVEADELIAYDHRLLAGAKRQGLQGSAPGLS
jgi:predicted nucleic acid-binding protein